MPISGARGAEVSGIDYSEDRRAMHRITRMGDRPV
jgi:hypothetical protein